MHRIRIRFVSSLLLGAAALLSASCMHAYRPYGYQYSRGENRGYGGSGYLSEEQREQQREAQQRWEHERREGDLPPPYDPRYDPPRRYEGQEGYIVP